VSKSYFFFLLIDNDTIRLDQTMKSMAYENKSSPIKKITEHA